MKLTEIHQGSQCFYKGSLATTKEKLGHITHFLPLSSPCVNLTFFPVQMRGAMEDLKKSTKALEEDVNINKEDFRRAINQVIKQAKEGPEFLQQKGPGLINKLANDYIDEVRWLLLLFMKRD